MITSPLEFALLALVAFIGVPGILFVISRDIGDGPDRGEK